MQQNVRLLFSTLAILTMIVAGVACQQATPAAQETESAEINYVPYENEELGISLEYPEGWVTHDAFGGVTLASSQDVIEGESLADIGDGVFVNVIAKELAVFGMQAGEEFSSEEPGEVLTLYRALLENEGQTFTVRQPPQIRTVNGQNVAQMTVESEIDGEQMITIFSIIINDEFMAIVSAGALAERFDSVEPVLLHVLDSIVVSPPSSIQQ